MSAGLLFFNAIIQSANQSISHMAMVKVEQHGFTAFSWFAGWLFTIGFLHLAFWQGMLAVVLWPYYLGLAVSVLAHK